MKNLKLQWNSIKRNKMQFLFLILSALIYLGVAVYYLVLGIMENVSSYVLVGATLHYLPIWILFYIYISLEACYEIQNYKEAYCLSKKGMTSIYKTQLSIIILHILFITSVCFFTNMLYIIISKQIDFYLILHTACLIFFYFFLCCAAAAFIGLALSQLKKKYFAQTAMILIAVSGLSVTDPLTSVVATLTGKSVFKLSEILNLFPYSVDNSPIFQTGLEIADDKIMQFLFFITLGILVTVMLQSRKKTAKIAICAALCVSMLIGYFMPYASFKGETAINSIVDYLYSDKYARLLEDADFNVQKYDMKLSAFRKLKADVKIYVDRGDLSEYKFTLYHGYRIKKISSQSGEVLSFEQNGDYVTVRSDSHVEFLDIKYAGYCEKFYSTYKNVFLPANFAFYPVPGFKEVFSKESGSCFVDSVLPQEAEFKVRFDFNKRIVSNLDEASKNEFEGKGKSLTLLGGYIRETEINGAAVYYPYFDKSLNEASLAGYIGEFANNHPEIKKIIVIPNVNSYEYERRGVYDDYMIADSVYGIEQSYFKSIIPPEKQSLYSWKQMLIQLGEQGYERNKDYNLNDIERKELELAWEIISNDSDGEKMQKIDQYLINDEDSRTSIEFLESIR